MSETISLVQLADAVACHAHRGQVDKAGKAYILHPRAVAAQVEGEEAKAAALLHDVLEDTDITEDTLRNLFGDRITDTVCTLTHRKGESYEAYICRIGDDPPAARIKLADLRHNLDLSRLPRVTQRDLLRAEKYRRSTAYLLTKIPQIP